MNKPDKTLQFDKKDKKILSPYCEYAFRNDNLFKL
jgi:hypothetical protein